MIYQAERTDNRALIGEATCISKLAALVATQASDSMLPRIAVYDSVRNDRWYNQERERELAIVLLRDCDVLTEPIRNRVQEHAIYWKSHLPLLNQVEFAKKLMGAFGLRKIGPTAILLGWKYYLEAASP